MSDSKSDWSQIDVGELHVLRRFLPQNRPSVVFDVGANRGAWSVLALDHAPFATIHAFEPQAAVLSRLQQRLARGSEQGRVRVSTFALSADNEVVDFHIYAQDDGGWSSVHRRKSVELTGSQGPVHITRVPARRLDDYCVDAGVSRIDFLKIDVEGHELHVLRGASGLLRRKDIDFIQFEYGGTYYDAGTSLRDVFSLLNAFCYDVFKIRGDHLVHCPEFVQALEDFQYANYLAVHRRFRPLLLNEEPKMVPLREFLRSHRIPARGVIHIGANDGSECDEYIRMGFEKILYIEANPSVFARLKANVSDKPGVIIAQSAISDREGETQLHVMSMDQSSSILPLKEHRQLYPHITEQKTITVRTQTIDALLAELCISPSDFNFLNMDIHGAELQALRGAASLLPHIDAINTEVSLIELYEGAPLLKDVDDFLQGSTGFQRVELVTPYHPDWGDAVYVRRPAIGMPTLGRNGRFGNQLFQYAFLSTYANAHGLKIETSPWVGQRLFGLTDPPPRPRRVEFQQSPESMKDGRPQLPNTLADTNVWGYFQYHTSYYRPYRTFLRNLFDPVEPYATSVRRTVDILRRRGRTVVGLHVRRGDYGYKHFFKTPLAWYRSWLEDIWHRLERPVLFVASDDLTQVLPHFADYDPAALTNLGERDPELDFYGDFYVLSQCDALAISNSSYSLFASMMNKRAAIFSRPDLRRQKLIPYDPWNCDVLFQDSVEEYPIR